MLIARDHRLHHKYPDTDADPSNANLGFFYSHIGWLMLKRHHDAVTKGRDIDITDLLNDHVVVFHKKYLEYNN